MAKVTNTVILDAIEIIIYVSMLPLAVFLGIRHGRKFALGYIYLGIFSILRIVADGLGIANRNSTNQNTIVITQALGSAGLSPLLLVLAALAHEAHHYHIKATLPSHDAQNLLGRLKALQGFFHVLSAGGMGLIAYAAQKSVKADDEDEANKWQNVRKLGVIMMFFAAVAENLYSIYVWISVRRSKKSSASLRLTTFTTCTSIGGIFVGIRAVYSIVYTFDKNPDINPLTGKFIFKLIFVVLVQFIAVAWLVSGAWVTKDIRWLVTYGSIPGSERLGNDADSTIPLTYQSSTSHLRETNQVYSA